MLMFLKYILKTLQGKELFLNLGIFSKQVDNSKLSS